MPRTRSTNWGACALATILALTLVGSGRATESATVKAQFADPPRQYSTGPLWTWNDLLSEKQIKSTLADLAGQRVRQVWVHPRPGLMTPYLGDDWFQMWKVALAEAERLDMNVWITTRIRIRRASPVDWSLRRCPRREGKGFTFAKSKRLAPWGTMSLRSTV